ncbi:DGQHR domain-containing protein [Acinetobacter sp. ANC 5380]|uniref:DGQHR domain-containing protein n=1 Tax=Acinetobacter terrae TaxID=2731247 RepID=A0A7Y2WCH1_9GAMM|nr:DNA sulfur modification protein DndB [Acinetobacter terrae]NNH79417.1 DGQHR domain-containing protein [Acinetobacter terrae]
MNKIFLPALRGRLGDWAYYTCVMSFKDLVERVKTADEIHKSKKLSEYIQRQLNQGRAKDISKYILSNESRFFNSIVVAVYGGAPEWFQLDNIRNVLDTDEDIKDSISENTISTIGFLRLSGEESLFALDGQHRLTGIKQALKDNHQELEHEEVSVIFVGHKNDESGLQRTRKLFIDLNKSAKAVTKNEIIALDECDVIAITTRWLIEEDERFTDRRILISANPAMPNNNFKDWTNIINLYDVLELLFTKVRPTELKIKVKKSDLTTSRPNADELQLYFDYAQRYFSLLGRGFPEISEYFASNEPEEIVAKFRKFDGGSVLFRPVGLLVFTNLVAEYIKVHNCSLENAFEIISKLETNLSESPYKYTIWNYNEKKMEVRKKSLLLETLKYQLNLLSSSKEEKLIKTIADNNGVETSEVQLPEKVI